MMNGGMGSDVMTPILYFLDWYDGVTLTRSSIRTYQYYYIILYFVTKMSQYRNCVIDSVISSADMN